jgi:hypothetical protein
VKLWRIKNQNILIQATVYPAPKHIMRSSISALLLTLASLQATSASPVPKPQAAAAANTSSSGSDLGASTTQNGLTDSTGCKAMTVIFARGTTEQGNVGTLSGPPFFDALSKVIGVKNLAVQGVVYPADIPGFLAGGDANGSKNMAQLVQQVCIAPLA